MSTSRTPASSPGSTRLGGRAVSWPAALSIESAVRAAEGPGRHDAERAGIDVAVGRNRHLVAPPGVQVHRVAGFSDRVQRDPQSAPGR